MSESKNPSDIAREALKRLAARHLPPTPANFQACYNEIAGLPDVSHFPEAMLRDVVAGLVPHNTEQAHWLDRVSGAIARRSWRGVKDALYAFCEAAPEASRPVLAPHLAESLSRFVETVLPALGDEDSQLPGMAKRLIDALHLPAPDPEMVDELLGGLLHQVEFAAEEQVEIKESLLKLLHLIIENIGELAIDDSWLKGQVDGLLASVAPPLTLRHLDEIERRLRDVMEKQGRARSRSLEAQAEMREMLAAFIQGLAKMNDTSSSFQTHIEESARKIAEIASTDELKPLLDDIIHAAHQISEETARSREQLKGLQDQVLATEAELVQLHLELDNASNLARHDPLTDALNRKGLDEALAREIAGMRRKDTPLSLCLLDIDNFKQLNDRLGHEAGDGALVHLAEVVRRNLRPSDTLARYGGEEFVILMPETDRDQGVEAMVRLQRELTKAIYLSGRERILITFSAGVAQLGDDESGNDAIKRADQAMYLAKRAGKNRVWGA